MHIIIILTSSMFPLMIAKIIYNQNNNIL